jgi:hypothetical protein
MLASFSGAPRASCPGGGRIAWRRLALYAESEYVFDLEEIDDSFSTPGSRLP